MLLIVSEDTQIPHLVGKHVFNPFCEVDEHHAKDMIHAYPKKYREISRVELASIDITKWKTVDLIGKKTLKEVADLLTEDQKKDVLGYVRKLLSPKIEEPAVKALEQMTTPELRSYARNEGIEIPEGATKKAEILEAIKSAEATVESPKE
jgi:hypothetical protein